MFDFFYSLSDIQLLIFLSCISIPVSFVAIAFVRYCLPIRLLYRDNGVIGNISALIGIIYGVLAGLTALYLINNISFTEDAVQREVNAISNIYRDSLLVKAPVQAELQTEIRHYLSKVIDVEWPLLKKGKKLDNEGEMIINKMSKTIYDYAQSHATESFIAQDAFSEVKTLYNAREQRIHMSDSQLNSEIWIVILIGTVLTLGVNYFFKMGFALHVITSSAAAIMAAAIIFLLVTLDRPFQGEFVVESDAFQLLLKQMDKDGH